MNEDLEWARKNQWLLIAIVTIIILVILDGATLGYQKQEITKQCNAYWENQVKDKCPVIAGIQPIWKGYNQSFSMANLSIENSK